MIVASVMPSSSGKHWPAKRVAGHLRFIPQFSMSTNFNGSVVRANIRAFDTVGNEKHHRQDG